ncbi:MAG: lipase maturation factor family protein [Phycisphaerales bacterium]|nr:lipase maturation factor family protein [Phycisphaerales bacterium]
MGTCDGCSGCDHGCGSGPPVTSTPDGRPRVIWDGDCTFCRRWATRWCTTTGRTFAWTPLQNITPDEGLDVDALKHAVHVQQPDGTLCSGARAVCTVIAQGGVSPWPLRAMSIPGLSAVANTAYRWIARHRNGADRACRALMGKVEIPNTWQLTRRVVLRCMGLIYLLAFISLGTQIDGLAGSEGLRPIGAMLEMLRVQAPELGVLQVPTAQWFGGDGLLQATWIVGAIAAVTLLLGVVPLAASVLCWLCMLSLITAATIFTSYQWDMLLLEAGLLTILWSPRTLTLHRSTTRPSPLVRWMCVLLLVKLMVSSGWVKLASGDPTWTNDTALLYHFWTQPLPWWPAWYAAHIPDVFLWFLSKAMFAAELWLPWLLLLPRIPRTVAALGIIVLQLGIALTGNYGWFNWLTIVLALAMLDDAMLLLLWPRAIRHRFRTGPQPRPSPWTRRMIGVCCAALATCSVATLPAFASALPGPARRALAALQPWHFTSNYGLFATMTTTRPEIVIETSDDGEHWTPIAFKAKPGPVDQAPALSQPMMPRLDWQLWFDALTYERLLQAGHLTPDRAWDRFSTRFVLPDLVRELDARSPSVRRLLADVPEAPSWLRWSLWQYTIAPSGPDWWTRTKLLQSTPRRLRAADASASTH